MKTFFAITLLALVAGTYCAPTSDLTSALINQLNDDELISLLDLQAPKEDGEDGDNDIAFLMARMQDDDDKEGIAQLEAMMQDARYQKWFKSLGTGSKLKSFGKNVYNDAKKVSQKIYTRAKKVFSNPIVKGLLPYAINKYSPIPIPIKAESQNDIDEDGIAELEAMLENAKIEGWMDSLKKYGSKALSGAKNVAESPLGKEIAMNLLYHYMPEEEETEGDETETDDGNIALMLAKMQDEDGDDEIAELEAILQNAKIEGWMDSLKKYGSKAYNVAGSPMGREIATSLLDYYMPKEAETQGDKKFSELLDSLLDA